MDHQGEQVICTKLYEYLEMVDGQYRQDRAWLPTLKESITYNNWEVDDACFIK